MGVHPFRDPSRDRILLDNLAETPRGVGLTPPRFKQADGTLGALSFNILRQFPPEVGWKEDIAIFVPLTLVNAEVTRLQIHIGEAEPGFPSRVERSSSVCRCALYSPLLPPFGIGSVTIFHHAPL
jgi:hypothetical protein